jgi:hypothetical protein
MKTIAVILALTYAFTTGMMVMTVIVQTDQAAGSWGNMRTASLIMLSGLFVQVAHADEIRRHTFPNVMLGTWAETAEQCAAKDKTNIVIEPTKYRDGGGDCAVRWIVETAGSDGINYAVHSFCISASLPEKTQTKDIIVRPLGPDRAAMGRCSGA